MACAVGCGSASGSWAQFKDSASRRNVRSSSNNKKGLRVSCVSSAAVSDPYKTLRIQPGASESEVKKAFRQLALQVYLYDPLFFSFCPTRFLIQEPSMKLYIFFPQSFLGFLRAILGMVITLK